MKIRCAKCKSEIQLQIKSLPPTGLEIKCNNCGATFKLKKKSSKSKKSPESSKAKTTPPKASSSPTPPSGALEMGPPPRESRGSGVLEMGPPPVETRGSGALEMGPPPSGKGGEALEMGPPPGENKGAGVLEMGPPPGENKGAGVLEMGPPPAKGESPSGGSGADLDDELLGGIDDLLGELDSLSDVEEVNTYRIKGKRGNIFGPFDIHTIEKMLETGQLTGEEEVNKSGTEDWIPISELPELAHLFRDEEAPEESVPSAGTPSSESVRAERDAGGEREEVIFQETVRPAELKPLEEPEPAKYPAPEEEQAPPATSGDVTAPPPPQKEKEKQREPFKRIRSALKQEVLEGEVLQDKGFLEQLKDPENRFKVIGLLAAVVILLSGAVAGGLYFFSNLRKKEYKPIKISLLREFAHDSLFEYRAKLSNIDRKLRRWPEHPDLLVYKTLLYAMMYEHYPFPQIYSQLQKSVQSFPPLREGEKPSESRLWARAMAALAMNKGSEALQFSERLAQKNPVHPAPHYIRGVLYLRQNLYKKAISSLEKAEKTLNEPARIHYTRALLSLKRKEYNEAFESFSQAIHLSPQHFQAYLQLFRLLPKISPPPAPARLRQLWTEAEKLFSNQAIVPAIRGEFFFLQAQFFRREKQYQKALEKLLIAGKFNQKYRKLYPSYYLDTYNYPKIIQFLESKFKILKKTNRKKLFRPELLTAYLEVFFRIGKSRLARISLEQYAPRCIKCEEYAPYWYWRGVVYEEDKLYLEAIKYYDRAINLELKKKNKFIAPLAAKYRVAFSSGKVQIAEKMREIVEAVEGEAREKIDLLSLCQLYWKREDYLKIKKFAELGLKQYPKDEFFNRMMGLVYLRHFKDFDKAEKYFNRAVETFPGDSESLNGLGEIMIQRKEYDRAIALYKKLIELNPKSAINYLQLGKLYFLKGKFLDAISNLKLALERERELAEAYYYLGRAYEKSRSGSKSRVRRYYERAMQLDPKNLKYLAQMAKFFYQNQKPGKALLIYRKILRDPKLSPEERYQIRYNQAKLFYELQYWNRALKEFQKLYRESKSEDIAIWIADTYNQLKKYSAAATWYQKAIKILQNKKPKSEGDLPTPELLNWKKKLGKVYYKLGETYLSKNRKTKALKWYRMALKLDPDNIELYQRIGYIYKEFKNWRFCKKFLKLFLDKAPKNHIDRADVQLDLKACENP